jgi:hypothetical protein
MKTTHLLILFFAITALTISCQKEKSFEGEAYTLRLNFQPSANGEPLQFNKEYINPIGEDYKVTTFKFYVSKISLLQELPTPVARKEDGFFLVDASNPASQIIEVQLNSNPFNRLMFQVGIDSIYNVSGAQTGALDPLNGMFWTWNSGYIMFKLEGNSTASTADLQRIEHHIGGYKGSDNVATVIQLDFNTAKKIEIKAGATTELVIETNLDNYWHGNAAIKIAELPMCMITGEPALKVAKNFTRLFSVKEINQAP